MSSQLPPNPNLSTFNNQYWISADQTLTQSEADLLYLKFPVSQSQSESFIGAPVFQQGFTSNSSGQFNNGLTDFINISGGTIDILTDDGVGNSVDTNWNKFYECIYLWSR